MGDQRSLATSREVAEYLSIPVRTLDDWAHRGTGPRYSKVGRYRGDRFVHGGWGHDHPPDMRKPPALGRRGHKCPAARSIAAGQRAVCKRC